MVTLLIIVIVVALALQRYSIRRAKDTKNLKYICRPSVRSCEPGEPFLVHSNVSNPGKRSSATLHIEERFPQQLCVLEAEQFNEKVHHNGFRIFNSNAIIKRKQLVKRVLRASIAERGEYIFSYANFHAGDFLGFNEYSFRMENDGRIVIYPPRLENESFLKTFSTAANDIAQKKHLLEDPMSVCGYDSYTGREPLRKISWKQSAIRGELMVKQFDPVWNRSVLVVLDMHFHQELDYHFKRKEICFSLARTVCEDLENLHLGYRFLTNALISDRLFSFESEGEQGGSFRKLLYALGIAKATPICSLDETIRAVCDSRGDEKLIVFIATRSDDEVSAAIEKIKSYTGAEVITLFADAISTSEDNIDSAAANGGAAS